MTGTVAVTGPPSSGTRRHRRRAADRSWFAPRGPALLLTALLAVVATAAGGGLGIRYALKTGLTTTSALGLAVLAMGLVLLGVSAVASWRSLRGWRRLWLLPVALVVPLLVMSLMLGVMYSHAPRTALGPQTPAERGLTHSEVSFVTSDGVRLSAWFVPSRNRAAVVLLHGAGSTRSATLAQARVLAGQGFGVLLVDARGQGESGGSGMDLGWYGDRDVAAAVAFLRREADIDPDRVALLGLSMGGEEAIGAARVVASIRAVVAEGATSRTAQDKAGWLPGGVSGAVQRALDWVTYGVVDLLSTAPRPASLHSAIAGATTTHFLLITAGDVPDEARAAAYLRTAAPDRVRVWTVPGAAHTRGLAVAPAEWTARVVAFLNQTLR